MPDLEEQIAAEMGDEQETPAEPEPEPKEGELEPDAEPEPAQPEPEPAQPEAWITPEEIEKRYNQIRKAFTTYTGRVTATFGDEAVELLECPLCSGFVPGFVDRRAAGQLARDIVDTTSLYLGLAREQDYEADPDIAACTRCKGKGKTKTGSTVPGKETVTCRHCNGFGYYPPPSSGTNGTAAVTSGDLTAVTAAASGPQGDRDDWGEPRILPDGRENPNYGKMPHMKIRVEPWGATANLTVQDAVGA